MTFIKQCRFVIVLLMVMLLLLCFGTAQAAEGEPNSSANPNHFQLRFSLDALTADGDYVYQRMIYQDAKREGDVDYWGLTMLDLNFTVSGEGLSDVRSAVVGSGTYYDAFVYGNAQDGFGVDVVKMDNLLSPWSAPGDGFTYLATVVTDAPAHFALDEDRDSSISTSGGGNESAPFELLEPAIIAEVEVGNDDTVSVSAAAPVDGYLICAAYESNNRMIAVSQAQHTLKVLDANWDMSTDIVTAATTELTLNCDTAKLSEVRLFVVKDLSSWQPLTRHLIVDCAGE